MNFYPLHSFFSFQEFVNTLNLEKLKFLVLRRYQCGAGIMEHITTLLNQMSENDLEENNGLQTEGTLHAEHSGKQMQPKWCICGNCIEMPQQIENKCCRRRNNCIIQRRKFTKFCIDPENLEMCIKNTTDIRNDARNSSTRAFRKAAYRQYVLWQHGYLGKEIDMLFPHVAF